MADTSTVEKQDSLEDSLSSEEWTIIYKKESKANGVSEEKTDNEKSNQPKETVVTEDACHSEKSIKTEVEHVEEGEEAGEKELESDDVSILSDESEPEHIAFEEGRVERIEWQVERKQAAQLTALAPKPESDGNISSNALITCSVVALILGVIIAGQIVEFRGNKPSYSVNTDIEEKLRELTGIEEKLKELNYVKQALDQIRVSMPEMKMLKDQLTYQKYEKDKPKYSIEDYKNFEKLNIQNILNLNAYDDRLEMLEVTYHNFCSTINKINSSSPMIENELCKTPKILSDMILFKKNLKSAFEQTKETVTPEKRMFIDVERKLDSVSDTLLSELTMLFSRFSLKIQERLNKFGYKLHKRLCLLKNSEKANDKFFNILLDDEFFINNCNETSSSDPIVLDLKANASRKEEKHNERKKRSYEELKKNGYKYDFKNIKDHKKNEDSREDYSNEKEYNEEIIGAKSKGEVKSDNNWKKSKYENKEKYSQEDKKYNKHEKFDSNHKNDYNKKNRPENDFDNSFKSNKREHDYERKFENKRERDYDHKFEHNKQDHDYNHKFEHRREYDFDHKFEYNKKDRNFEHNFDHKFDHNKKEHDFDRKFENKRNFDYDDDDSKFIINVENDVDQFTKSGEEKQRYKNDREFILKPENFKESKHSKYQGNDCRDKKDKYQPSGDWQMQRGKAREKLRNSDWYFVRADSRRRARIDELEEDEEEEEEEEVTRSPPPSRKKQRRAGSETRGKEDNFRRRVLRRVGRTWDFLNAKFRNYF